MKTTANDPKAYSLWINKSRIITGFSRDDLIATILAFGTCLRIHDEWQAVILSNGGEIELRDRKWDDAEDGSYSLLFDGRGVLTGMSREDVNDIILSLCTLIRLDDDWVGNDLTTGDKVIVKEESAVNDPEIAVSL